MQHLKSLLRGQGNQIGRRLIVHTILFSSVITLGISAAQLVLEYRGLRNALDRQLEGVSIYLPTIAGSVWDFDQKQVQRALEALILLPNVAQASITAAESQEQWSVGTVSPDNVVTRIVTRSYSLRHDVRGVDSEIGTLRVQASLDGIYRQILSSAISILLSNGLKTFLVALFMVYLIRRLITVRLEKMAFKVHALIPATLPLDHDAKQPLQTLPESLDELDAVDWTLDKTAADLGLAVAALARLNAELEQRVQDRTKELESFSYSVSHDLRTPLRAIDGFSRLLLEDYEAQLDAEGQRLLHVVRTNTVRMGQLIDDILEFSRMGRQELGLGSIDMERLVRSIFEDLRNAHPERAIELEVHPLQAAQGDHAMVRQLLINLLANAIKFTGPRALAHIEVGSTSNGGERCYYVKDNGVGFDMQYVNKLFNVFERLHSTAEFEGTGIGLAIVKRIALRHGGRVWANSQLDQGTTIFFTLAPTLGE